MDIFDGFKKAFKLLIDSDMYTVNNMIYDEGCFGNILIVLESDKRINVEFVKDRNYMSCLLGLKTDIFHEWIDIEDIFSVLNIEIPPLSHNDTYEFVEQVSKIIYESTELMIKLADKKYFKKVVKQVRIFQKNRFESLQSK